VGDLERLRLIAQRAEDELYAAYLEACERAGDVLPAHTLGLPAWAQGLVEDWADAIEQSREHL
jgi:hypothetical protein